MRKEGAVLEATDDRAPLTEPSAKKWLGIACDGHVLIEKTVDAFNGDIREKPSE